MREELRNERIKKLHAYEREAPPYPARVRRDMDMGEFCDSFAALVKKKKPVALVGRVWSIRMQGKIMFADLRDERGSAQAVLEESGTNRFRLVADTLDRGDFLEIRGLPFRTKRGERSIAVREARIVAKSLRPIPTERDGLADMETRLRKRYLDLLVNPEERELFKKKEIFWDAIRSALKEEEFREMFLPVLEPVPGGADAEPFVTHLNALDEDFYLRISLELPLKKMLVGGFERVFEIGRIFRNEGIDWEHLQDYTQMECYAAYWDYGIMMRFVERLYKRVIKETFGTQTLTMRGKKISWSGKWPRVEYDDAFRKGTGINLAEADERTLAAYAKKKDMPLRPGLGAGRLIDLIYKHDVRPKLVQPCFLVNPPVEIEPLAKRLADNPRNVERFQVIAAGTELGKGFSELNDPLDQRERFEEQMRLRERGDKEAQRLDEDFLEALEYGMPPAAGFGMSERLFALLADRPVREATVFPVMKRIKK